MHPTEIELFKTQYEFLTAEEPIVCWIGGVGCGKSWSLAWWVLNECMKYPGNIGMLAAATNPQLRMATIPTFKEVFDLAGIQYEFSEWRGVFEFANGSWFKAQSLDIPAAELKGSTLGFLAIDEADACPKEHIEKLIARLRRQNASRRCRLIGNSPPPGHFLEQWYGPKATRRRGRLLQSPTYENHLLPKDYIEKLETQYPPGSVEYRRYVMGEMGVPLEGLVYTEFDKRHIIPASKVPWNRVVGYINALDLGAGHYTVFMRAAVTDDDRVFVFAEYAGRRTELAVHANRIKELLALDPADLEHKRPYEDNVGAVWCDHDLQDRLELAVLGIDTIPAIKGDKAAGISAVKSRLNRNTLFFVDGSCAKLMEELPYYVWHPKNDDTVRENDDACFTGDVEVLTRHGWGRLDELDPSAEIASVTPDGLMDWEVPSRIVRKKYTGGMHSVDHTNLSFVATDNHQHAVASQMDWKVRGIYKLSKKTVDELPAESYWAAIPKKFPAGPGVFSSSDEAWIAGLWVAEGCFDSQRPTFVLFDQKKPAVVAEIRKRLFGMGVVWSETITDSGVIRFCISGARELAEHLRSRFCCMSYGKKLSPDTILEMTEAERAEFLDGYMAGDGCRAQPGWHFDSISKRLVDGVQVLASTLGYMSVVRTWDCMSPKKTEIMGREVEQRRYWRGSVHRKKPFTHLRLDRIKRFNVVDMDVFCPTVSTGMFWARHNGKTFVAGNCDCLRYLIGGFDLESPEIHL